MFALLAFVAFLVGFIVSHAAQHVRSADFWLFIGLMLISLHLFLGTYVARRWPRTTV